MKSRCVCSGAVSGWYCSSSVLLVWSLPLAIVFSLALLLPVLLILWGSLVTHSLLALRRVPLPHDTALSIQLKDYSLAEVLHFQKPSLPLWKDSTDFLGWFHFALEGRGPSHTLSLNTCYQFYPNIPGCLSPPGEEFPPRVLQQNGSQPSSTLGFSTYQLLNLSFPPKAFSPRGAQDSSIWTLWPFLPFSGFLPQTQDRLFPNPCPILTLHLSLCLS